MSELVLPKIDKNILSKKSLIVSDLKKIINKDNVLSDADEIKPYETDALAAYKNTPLAVVLPENTQEVSEILKYCNNENIKVISSNFFNPELSLKTGNYTKLKVTTEDTKSIKKGILYFNQLNNLDHIQALIVKDNVVIASEGNQGTKKMLSKLKKRSGGILIKLPKKKQDLRMDLPTIGLNTLKDCKKYGLKGIVLKSKKNIFLDKAKCINFANRNKIFIKVI